MASVSFAGESFSTLIAPTFDQYCVKCHGGSEELEADLDLASLGARGLSDRPELIRQLIDVLELNEMPPIDQAPLGPKLREQLVEALRSQLHVATDASSRLSHIPLRRMNRFQFNNAVIDLFDLRCNVFTLPERMMREHKSYFRPETGRMADTVYVGSRPLGKSQLIEARLAGVAAFPQDLRAEHGYDNRGDHLSLSPLLMQSFLELGQSIVGSPDFDRRNVGIWSDFFEPPPEGSDLIAEVRSRLNAFLERAFRRPVDDLSSERYVAYVAQQLSSGEQFSDAMKSVAGAIISSPKFIYLYDKFNSESTNRVVDDFELASRLSFFLWGSIPDPELLQLAAAGKLTTPSVLAAQFERMLRDPKLKRFCDSFPSQWLQLERIISSTPSPDKFPEFYYLKYRDSMHMMLEPLLLFETILIENLPILQLIDADFTYRSSLLEEAYQELASESFAGKKGNNAVAVLEFHRTPISDRRNGGVITNAAVMTMTSSTDRTKPISRGAWLAAVVFNEPPKPPPADVPALAENPPVAEQSLTLRERLSMHRQRADCRGCHERIDPLGFALENYNAIGVWRETYDNGRQIDASGELFGKHHFRNVVEFKDAILAEKDRFTRGFAGHLLSFALARELDAGDENALDEIVRNTASDDYRIQTLLKQIILSEPFQSKAQPSPQIPVVNQ
ncbi:MAG: DUF1592 domain-containing protein [Planctomycetales bacterium]|nr:DUF1592 domain-containing protein [Planctomycetales bacterium]